MKINIRTSAIKDLNKIDRQIKNRIHKKILNLTNFPDVSNIKKLTNFEPAYRLRIGNYRILFDVYDDTIEIGRVCIEKTAIKKESIDSVTLCNKI